MELEVDISYEIKDNYSQTLKQSLEELFRNSLQTEV